MKKSIIAAGAASVALAAMPIVGAFATNIGDVLDDIHVVVSDGCTITREGSVPTGGDATKFEREVTLELVAGGAFDTDSTNAISIACSKAGWTVSAAGSGVGGTALQDGASTPHTIATSNNFTSGSSAWGMKVTLSNATASNSFDTDYQAVPASTDEASDKLVATGSAKTGSVTPSYKAVASSTQDAGTYNGQVTYSVVLPE